MLSRNLKPLGASSAKCGRPRANPYSRKVEAKSLDMLLSGALAATVTTQVKFERLLEARSTWQLCSRVEDLWNRSEPPTLKVGNTYHQRCAEL